MPNPDGTFSPLPALPVDTGHMDLNMRRASFNARISSPISTALFHLRDDIFRPIFDKPEKTSGNIYGSTLPKSWKRGEIEQEKIDVAFRVIA